MHVTLRLCVIFVACGFVSNQAQATECEPSPETRRELRRLFAQADIPNFGPRADQEMAGIETLLFRHPDDVFLNLTYQEYATDQNPAAGPAVIDRYRALADQHPGNMQYQFLYATSLINTHTPDAISRLKQIVATHPNFPLPHLKLARLEEGAKFADRADSKAQLNAFYAACPASLNSWALSLLESEANSEMAMKYAAQLRRRLENERDISALISWKTVWDLEFKGNPPAQHDQVRKRLGADLERLRKIHDGKDVEWLSTLAAGYRMAGDETSRRRVEDRILAEFSATSTARSLQSERWFEEHPYPRPTDPDETVQAFSHAMLEMADAGLKIAPDDFEFSMRRFEAISELDAATPEQIVIAGETVRNALRKKTGWFFTPPFEFQIADVYLKKRIHVGEVPALVDEGWKSLRERNAWRSDRESDEMIKNEATGEMYVSTEAARLLLAAAEQLSTPEIAKSAVDAVAALNPDKPFLQSRIWSVKGKWAELNGRKLDALLMYRAAIDSRSPDFHLRRKEKDEATESYDRLWKELGGTEEAKGLFTGKGKHLDVANVTDWDKPSKTLPVWELPDLQGKTWKLVDLHGKSVLINVWATWCGPCQAEHPYLQKLYEKERGRTDIQIVTFNVDDETGIVAPYMKKNKYTFPVLLAKDLVGDLLPELGIPQNWILDVNGKWQWMATGFSPEDESWEKKILKKLQAAGVQ